MAVILVGVVHRDPEGYERLLRLLESLGPEVLCVEFSPLGLTWREHRSAQLLKRLESILDYSPPEVKGHYQVQLIRAALEMPFEFRASHTHAEKYGVPLHLVDFNWISRAQLPSYASEMVTRRNLTRLAEGPDRLLEEVVNADYLRAHQCIRDPLFLKAMGLGAWGGAAACLRESFLACRVRQVAKRHGRVVYVGGWNHLVEDPQGHSLACRLKDLGPQRILLR